MKTPARQTKLHPSKTNLFLTNQKHNNNVFSDHYSGAFTYDGQNGTIELEDDNDVLVGTATFSISGTTMTLNLLGETYQLPKYVID